MKDAYTSFLRQWNGPLSEERLEQLRSIAARLHAHDAASFEVKTRQGLEEDRRGPRSNSILNSRAPVVSGLNQYRGYDDLRSVAFRLLLLDRGPATARSVIPRLAEPVPFRDEQIVLFRDSYRPGEAGTYFRHQGMWTLLCLLVRDFSRPPLPYGGRPFGILSPKGYHPELREDIDLINRVYIAFESRDPKKVAAAIRKAELDGLSKSERAAIRPADRYAGRAHAIAREATRLGIRHGIKKYEF